MITQDRLKEVCTYDPETGIFVGTVDRGRRYRVGMPFCRMMDNGYMVATIDKRNYLAHRLAWLYVYGEFPDGQVDHINAVRDDNRVENLRIATPQQQMFNRTRISTSQSGVKGVSLCKDTKKWRAMIKVSGVRVFDQYYETLEEARTAISAARRLHHGDFARD